MKELTRPGAGRRHTLILTLGAHWLGLGTPGLGDRLMIAGRGPAFRLARSAARDLWIPHRSNWKLFGLSPWIIGLRGSRADGPINPALLDAVKDKPAPRDAAFYALSRAEPGETFGRRVADAARVALGRPGEDPGPQDTRFPALQDRHRGSAAQLGLQIPLALSLQAKR